MDKYRIYYHPEDQVTPYWVCFDYNSERTLVAKCRNNLQAREIRDGLTEGNIKNYAE